MVFKKSFLKGKGNLNRKINVSRKIYCEKKEPLEEPIIVEMMGGEGDSMFGDQKNETETPLSTFNEINKQPLVSSVNEVMPSLGSKLLPPDQTPPIQQEELNQELTDQELEEKIKEIQECRRTALSSQSIPLVKNKAAASTEKQLLLKGNGEKKINKKRKLPNNTSHLNLV